MREIASLAGPNVGHQILDYVNLRLPTQAASAAKLETLNYRINCHIRSTLISGWSRSTPPFGLTLLPCHHPIPIIQPTRGSRGWFEMKFAITLKSQLMERRHDKMPDISLGLGFGASASVLRTTMVTGRTCGRVGPPT
jgi:hypothetical protein